MWGHGKNKSVLKGWLGVGKKCLDSAENWCNRNQVPYSRAVGSSPDYQHVILLTLISYGLLFLYTQITVLILWNHDNVWFSSFSFPTESRDTNSCPARLTGLYHLSLMDQTAREQVTAWMLECYRDGSGWIPLTVRNYQITAHSIFPDNVGFLPSAWLLSWKSKVHWNCGWSGDNHLLEFWPTSPYDLRISYIWELGGLAEEPGLLGSQREEAEMRQMLDMKDKGTLCSQS